MPSPERRPWILSGLIAGAYTLIAAGWITGSTVVASWYTGTRVDLLWVEIVKGASFAVVTGALLLVAIAWVLWREEALHQRLLAHRQELVVAERRALAGLIASTVAHDINNVLTLQRALLDAHPEADDSADPMVSQSIDSLARLAGQLLRLGQEVDEDVESVEITRLIRDTVALGSSHDQVRRCRIAVEIPPACETVLPTSLVERALLNLLLNAGRAAGPDGAILVRLACPENVFQLEVHDSGPGVPEDERAALFEPWTSRHTDQGGLGLGLVTVKACADKLGGTVEVTDAPELGGAAFVLRWPRLE